MIEIKGEGRGVCVIIVYWHKHHDQSTSVKYPKGKKEEKT